MQDLHLCHCILLADWRSRTWFNLLDSQMLKQLGHTCPIVTVICFQLCVGHDCSRNPFVGGGILFVYKHCLETRANECGGYLRHAHVVFMRFVYWNPNQARGVASVSLLLNNIKKMSDSCSIGLAGERCVNMILSIHLWYAFQRACLHWSLTFRSCLL